MAGGGGLTWDDKGNWVKGFTHSIWVTTNIEAELWALRDGLMLCVNFNLLAVDIEVVDARVGLGWVMEEFNYNLHHISLIMDCKTLINRIPQVKMKHCFCEANKCADFLARKGLSTNEDFCLLHCPPVDLSLLLLYDCIGLYYERECPLNFVIEFPLLYKQRFLPQKKNPYLQKSFGYMTQGIVDN